MNVASITRRRAGLAGRLGDLSKTPLLGRMSHSSAWQLVCGTKVREARSRGLTKGWWPATLLAA